MGRRAAPTSRRRAPSSERVGGERARRREQLTQDAHFAALQLAQARRQLALAAKADTVATKRFEVANNRYVIGRIGIDNLYIAQSEKDQALQQYVQALRGYWHGVLPPAAGDAVRLRGGRAVAIAGEAYNGRTRIGRISSPRSGG